MTSKDPIASHRFEQQDVAQALEFLKRTRSELRTLRKARVWTDRFAVYDINGDSFEITGIGFLDPEIVAILDHVNAAYKRDKIHEPAQREFKEFKTGRRYAWAADRVM